MNVNNRFALFLDEDDDPGDVIIAAPAKKEESTKTITKTSKQPAGKGIKGKENKDKTSQQANKKPTENGNRSEFWVCLHEVHAVQYRLHCTVALQHVTSLA